MSTKLTPMMQQYWTAKNSLGKEYLLLFRLGDFYELFFDDALLTSKLLGITLTKRNEVPMCGVPAHAVDGYIKKLLALGKKIAVCEQTSPVQKGSIVTREITETITPGTISDVVYLDTKQNNFLAAVTIIDRTLVYAWIDISTAELYVECIEGTSSSIDQLRVQLGRTQAKELIYPESLEIQLGIPEVKKEFSIHCSMMRDWDFSIHEGERLLREIMGVNTLKSYKLDITSKELSSICALLQYIGHTGDNKLSYINSIKIIHQSKYLEMDADAIFNLELFSSIREQNQSLSFIGILDKCETPMGSRCLHQWITYPLKDLATIKLRQQGIASLIKHTTIMNNIHNNLTNIPDFLRLMMRVMLHKAHAKDLVSIKISLQNILSIHTTVQESPQEFKDIFVLFFPSELIDKIQELFELISSALVDEPSIHFGSGYIIRSDYNAELQTLRNYHENQKEILNSYVEREQENSTITLRLKYNNVIGYFFDISQNLRDKVPKHFILRQSLSKQDRYKTTELLEFEKEILDAESSLLECEEQLFKELCNTVQNYFEIIQQASTSIAEIDVLTSLSRVAIEQNYICPEVVEENIIDIKNGRHPVIETYIPQGEFISNDLLLDEQYQSFIMLTGPNMSGKSTYLRQTALIVILAQIGSFVPAQAAKIGVRDKIFCRVGASDNIVRGESTFLVEMSETAYILQQAGPKSLVIMDEIGRGTSVSDGESLAQAVVEFFLEKNIFTLFATHYHNLTDIESKNLKNYTLEIEQQDNKILFIRKIKEGAVKNSYGIEVAKLAGIPEKVLERARELLKVHEKYTKKIVTKSATNTSNSKSSTDDAEQQHSKKYHEILNTIRTININQMTPIETQQLLISLQETLGIIDTNSSK